jgi:hypothetical protein
MLNLAVAMKHMPPTEGSAMPEYELSVRRHVDALQLVCCNSDVTDRCGVDTSEV